LVTQNHIEDLLVTLASKSSEQNHNRNVSSNFWNSSINFAAFFSLLDVELELKSRFIIFLVLGSNLRVPAVLAGGQFIIEHQN
jgi:hypothetical protein